MKKIKWQKSKEKQHFISVFEAEKFSSRYLEDRANLNNPLAHFWTCSWLYNTALGKITVYLVSTHHSENEMILQLF